MPARFKINKNKTLKPKILLGTTYMLLIMSSKLD